jgi:Flp pilus assembly pilin Flp
MGFSLRQLNRGRRAGARRERGIEGIEYLLIAALVIIASVAAWKTLGGTIESQAAKLTRNVNRTVSRATASGFEGVGEVRDGGGSDEDAHNKEGHAASAQRADEVAASPAGSGEANTAAGASSVAESNPGGGTAESGGSAGSSGVTVGGRAALTEGAGGPGSGDSWQRRGVPRIEGVQIVPLIVSAVAVLLALTLLLRRTVAKKPPEKLVEQEVKLNRGMLTLRWPEEWVVKPAFNVPAGAHSWSLAFAPAGTTLAVVQIKVFDPERFPELADEGVRKLDEADLRGSGHIIEGPLDSSDVTPQKLGGRAEINAYTDFNHGRKNELLIATVTAPEVMLSIVALRPLQEQNEAAWKAGGHALEVLLAESEVKR